MKDESNRKPALSRSQDIASKVDIKDESDNNHLNNLENPGFKRSKIPWSKSEDEQLRYYVNNMPTQCRISWTTISTFMVHKTAKQCRNRWFNHVLPNANKGKWTIKEDKKLLDLQALYGNKWTMMASFLSGRSDYDIRKRWYKLKKKLWSKEENEPLKEIVPVSEMTNDVVSNTQEPHLTIKAAKIGNTSEEANIEPSHECSNITSSKTELTCDMNERKSEASMSRIFHHENQTQNKYQENNFKHDTKRAAGLNERNSNASIAGNTYHETQTKKKNEGSFVKHDTKRATGMNETTSKVPMTRNFHHETQAKNRCCDVKRGTKIVNGAQSSSLSKPMAKKNNDEEALNANGLTPTQATLSVNEDICEGFSFKTNVQWQTTTNGSINLGSCSDNKNTKESHSPFMSSNNARTQIQEDQYQPNYLQAPPNQTRMAIQGNEGNQQQSDDDLVSFAYAVAYATAFIKAHNG